MPGVEIVSLGLENDHVHLVMIIPPRKSVAETIGYLKQRLTFVLRKKFPWLNKAYRGIDSIWSPGYFVSTVGVDEERIIKYVEWQGKEDSGQIRLRI